MDDSAKIEATTRALLDSGGIKVEGIEFSDLVQLVVDVIHQLDARDVRTNDSLTVLPSQPGSDGSSLSDAAPNGGTTSLPATPTSAVLYRNRDVVLTTTEAAAYIGMSRPYLVKLLESGEIPFHRVGRDRRVKLKDVEAFVEARDRAAARYQAAAISQTVSEGEAPQLV